MLLVESVLQRMQFAVLFETFNRSYRASIGLNGKCGARLDGAPVHNDGASATVTGVTTNMCAGQLQCFAEKVDQQQALLDVGAVFHAVNFYFDRICRNR